MPDRTVLKVLFVYIVCVAQEQVITQHNHKVTKSKQNSKAVVGRFPLLGRSDCVLWSCGHVSLPVANACEQ